MTEPTEAVSEPVFAVVEPVGPQRLAPLAAAAGLADLTGARIGFIWDSLFDGDLIYAAIAEELSSRFDGMTFVGHEVFGDIHGHAEKQVVAELPTRLRDEEVDAVVVGIGA
jgi:hypothetical protein